MMALSTIRANPSRYFFQASFFVAVLVQCVHSEEPAPSLQTQSQHPAQQGQTQSNPEEESVRLEGPILTAQPTWSEVLHAVVLTAIPDKYQDIKNWGKTKEIFGGLRIQQKGFRVHVAERKRTVNHGIWHKYHITLIEPAQTLKVVIEDIRPLDASRFQFRIRLASKLRCRGDFEHWVLGVKGLNMTVISDADVEVFAHCRLSIQTESNRKHFFPDLLLQPHVDRVEIFLTNLDVQRIGELRGDLAEGLGDLSRHDIENLLQSQETRVTKKINEAIEKKKSSLRIPASLLW